MRTSSYVEEMFLRANALIEEGNLAEGKQVLEEVLELEPRYGRAFNHLAWLYAGEFRDYPRAERFYRLAMKYAPDYPATYTNFGYLLMELNQLEEAEKTIRKGAEVPGTDLSTLNYQLGRIREAQGRYAEAVRHYKTARKQSFNSDFMVYLEKEMERARKKGGWRLRLGL